MGISRQIVALLLAAAGIILFSIGVTFWLTEKMRSEEMVLVNGLQTTSRVMMGLMHSTSEAQSAVEQMLREKDVDRIEELIALSGKLTKQADAAIASCGAKADSVKQAFAALAEANRRITDDYLTGEQSLARQEFIESAMPAQDKLQNAIRELHTRLTRQSEAEIAASHAHLALIRNWAIIGVFMGFVFFAVFGLMLRSRIMKRLTTVSNALTEASTAVLTIADQVSASSRMLAEGSSEQASSLEETAASMEELSATSASNVNITVSSRQVGSDTRSAAESGVQRMQSMSEAMQALMQAADDVARIIKTIDEIAFQTNLLALNAAIEAARAGEAGLSFAVVAEEVRNLSKRATVAARETANRIEESVRRSADGSIICSDLSKTFDNILSHARNMDKMMADIAEASRQQAQGFGQIEKTVTQMNTVVQGSAGSAEEMAASAEELKSQTIILGQVVLDLKNLLYGLSKQSAG